MARLNMEGLNRWQKMAVALLDVAATMAEGGAPVDIIEEAQKLYDAPTIRYKTALLDLVEFGAITMQTFPNHTPRGVIEIFSINTAEPMKLRAVWTGEYDPV